MTALRAPKAQSDLRLPTELSPTGKLVYLYLTECGSAGVEDLRDALGVPQIRLYPTIESLERRGLVARAGDEFAVPR